MKHGPFVFTCDFWSHLYDSSLLPFLLEINDIYIYKWSGSGAFGLSPMYKSTRAQRPIMRQPIETRTKKVLTCFCVDEIFRFDFFFSSSMYTTFYRRKGGQRPRSFFSLFFLSYLCQAQTVARGYKPKTKKNKMNQRTATTTKKRKRNATHNAHLSVLVAERATKASLFSQLRLTSVLLNSFFLFSSMGHSSGGGSPAVPQGG